MLHDNFDIVLLYKIKKEINENPYLKTLKSGQISGPSDSGSVVGGGNWVYSE